MKILVYDDNPDYGGHQAMACHGVAALAADPALEVAFMFNPANRRLAEGLAGIRTIQPSTAFKALGPDRVLCIQGDIAQSTKGIRAARRAGIPCVSYLAIPHSMQTMGAKFGALRDRLNHHLLNLPDRYIVISESMEKILVERGATKPITIVPNGIRPPQSLKPKAQSLLTLGLIGRVEFKQKQQDFMVRTFLEFPEAFKDAQLLIAGDGPDAHKLRKLVAGKQNITLLPWQDDAESFYRQIDCLLIPSRFEGVPLVMLEALARGIPVLGSRRDGMRDLLPDEWLFDPENGAAVAQVFSNARNTWQTRIEPLRKKVATGMTIEAFKANFHRAVVQA